VEILEQNGIPHYQFPEAAARTMSALYQYSCWLRRQHLREFEISVNCPRVSQLIGEAMDGGSHYLGEVEGNEILAAYGFPVMPGSLATNEDEAAAAVTELGRCAMKIVSPQIVHKSDIGGVRVGIATEEAARIAFREIMAAGQQVEGAVVRGVLMQKMAASGVEVILGIKRYATFGPLLMFGLGGIFVEIFKDVSFRLAPIRRNGAHHMVRSIRAFPILNGARNAALADVTEIERCLMRLSMLATDHPEIAELDINPLLVHEDGSGCSVADCRILLSPPAPTDESLPC
jgi:acetyltransferase